MGKKSREKKQRVKPYKDNTSIFKNRVPERVEVKPRAKIMVGMPIHHYMEPFTWTCIENTRAFLEPHRIDFIVLSPTGIPDVAKARNECVKQFLKHDSYTHLMWIDADMVWSPESVLTLLEHDVPVSSALVTKKAPPFDVTLFQVMLDEDGSPNTYKVQLGSYPLDKPFTMSNGGIGTAFMLLRREVIEKIPTPHFAGFIDKKRTLKGTDLYFCLGLLQAGYEILFDPRLRVYHVGKSIYGLEDSIAFLDKSADEGVKACPFMSSNAKDVELYKRSFSGPEQSLIASTAPVVARQLELSQQSEGSKLETSSCPSSVRDDQTNQEKKTGTDQPK